MIDLTQNGKTHRQILEMLGARQGRGRMSFEIQVLRYGSQVGSAAARSLTVTCDGLAAVKYTMQTHLEKGGWDDWQPFRLRPVLVWQEAGAAFRWPLAPPLRVARAERHYPGGGWVLEAVDELAALAGNSLDSSLLLEKGTPYLVAVEQLLAGKGMTAHNLEPCPAVLATGRLLRMGEGVLALCNNLLEEINYRMLEPDHSGVLRSRPYGTGAGERGVIAYREGDGSLLIAPVIEREECFGKPNRFVGYCAHPDLPREWTAEFTNRSPADPASTLRQGAVITRCRQFAGVPDEETLYRLVLRWAEEEREACREVVFHTPPMPHHGVLETVLLEAGQVTGRLLETGWRIEAGEGGMLMTHRARRASYG